MRRVEFEIRPSFSGDPAGSATEMRISDFGLQIWSSGNLTTRLLFNPQPAIENPHFNEGV